MRRMTRVFDILGIEHTRFDATDGQALTTAQLAQISTLPGYLDPFHRRPLKTGEIGCFLSHYRVWKEMVDENLERAIIFEDDVRFEGNALSILRALVEDLAKERTDWDLIYLGRKKNDAKAREYFVKGLFAILKAVLIVFSSSGHRYLSTVTYSYWTLGYALSRRGAQKLLDAQPLQRLVALDEFLPIMYNEHPNEEWSAQFVARNLRAFAVYPVVVVPQRYTTEPGYLSDTENSALINATMLGDDAGEQSLEVAPQISASSAAAATSASSSDYAHRSEL